MKWLLGVLLAVVLLGVSACGGEGSSDDGGEAAGGSSQEQAEGSSGADLEGVPDVVAEVNGEEIPKDEFVQAYELQLQQATAQAQASGQDIDQDQLKEQVAQNLVSTELLVQEADGRDITVSDKDVRQTLQELASQNGLEDVDAFAAALEEQGMDRDEVDDQVRTQLKIERLVSDEAGEIEVSKQEARALYDQLVAQQEQAGQQGQQAGQEMPPFAQVRPELEQQVKSQKESQVAQRLLGDLRESADIVVNL